MATQVKMPQLGETVVEGTITRWLKQEGDTVEADESLLEISTDKVDSEIPAPAAGTVVKIHAQEGDTVKVGALLAEIGEAGESAGAGEAEAEEERPELKEVEDTQAKEPSTREETGEEPAARQEKEPAKSEEEPEEAEEPAAEEKPSGPQKGEPATPKKAEPSRPALVPTSARVDGRTAAAVARPLEGSDEEPRRGILSPLVRKLAAEHNVDLEEVKGSGVGGRISKQDILSYIDSRGPEGARPAAKAGADAGAAARAEPAQETRRVTPAAPGAGEEVVQVTHMRKLIADHMVRSHLATARAWNSVEVDMTGIAHLREKGGPAFKKKEGFTLTWMPFITKAVCQALLRWPQLNSAWNDDGTITRKNYVNIGIAVALENGLIVPVVKGADGMNVPGLARAIRDIADRARTKKLSPDEVHGGTFTITNPGPFGSILSVPIINEGQAG
ncbi:MAG: dihydrolipoamide acetyltransferase family protein, partial [Actinomycetota bacterium]